MKTRIALAVTVVALLLSFALVGPAVAGDLPLPAGFNVDCEGATGWGDVPAGNTYHWRVWLSDVSGPLWNTEGDVSEGPFNPVVAWPDAPLAGSFEYYWSFSGGSGYTSGGDHLVCEPPPDGDGCTPGFWRQPQHMDSWVATGYSPADDFDTVFGTGYFDPDITLGDAIWAQGGGLKKLARHGTAGLLSAAHPDVGYPLTVAEVIAAVQAGDAKTLADYNELGCPID